jgi:hypothetical protein
MLTRQIVRLFCGYRRTWRMIIPTILHCDAEEGRGRRGFLDRSEAGIKPFSERSCS